MLARTWSVGFGTSEWNFSGLSVHHDRYLCTVPNLKPTVAAIRSLARELFPEYEIDERDMTLSEQIRSDLDLGMITVRFRSDDMFISHSMTMQEVY